MTRESSPPEATSAAARAGRRGWRRSASRSRRRPRGPQPPSRGPAPSQSGRRPWPARPAAHRPPRPASARPWSQCGQPARQRIASRGAPAQLSFGLLKRLVGVFELVAPGPAAIGVGEHVGDVAAVLALQPGQQGQALLHLLLAGLAGALLGQTIAGSPQLRSPGPRPRSAVRPSARRLTQRGVDRRGALELGHGAGEQLRDARPRRRGRSPRPRPARRPAASPSGAAGRARRPALPPPRRLGSAASISSSSKRSRSSSRSRAPASSRSSSARAAQLASAVIGRPQLPASAAGSGSAERVQELQLGGAEHQLAVLVLAVEGEQPAAELLQVGDRRRRGRTRRRGCDRRARPGARARSPRRRPADARSPAGRPGARTRPPHRPPRRPGRTIPLRALPPSSRSSACASRVLPAPVSPVSMFRPGARRTRARSISSRFSTRNSWSIQDGLPPGLDGPAALGSGRGQPPEFGPQPPVEGRARHLSQRGQVIDKPGLDARAGLEQADRPAVNRDVDRFLTGAVVRS